MKDLIEEERKFLFRRRSDSFSDMLFSSSRGYKLLWRTPIAILTHGGKWLKRVEELKKIDDNKYGDDDHHYVFKFICVYYGSALIIAFMFFIKDLLY